MSVVDNKIAWISGNNGYIGITTNGGTKWEYIKIPGFEELDFRTVYAFDDKKAIVASAGSPAYIFVTEDGGNTWLNVFKDERKEVFIDGITFFSDKEGIIFGDPLDGKMFLLRTTDGGKEWAEAPESQRPVMMEGEAAFAASGTSIRSINKKLIIASGGSVSRLFVSKDKGYNWKVFSTPIIQGKNSTGIFSFDFINENTIVIVGGDYTIDTLKVDNVFITKNGGSSWQKPETSTAGYRSCVEYINNKTLIATGTSGTDISRDGGNNWETLSSEGFHIVRQARKGNLVILAGTNGKIAIYLN